MQVNAGLSYLFDVPVSVTTQVLLIAAITTMATLSVVAGLNAGIRRLSVLNLYLAIFVLAFVFFMGPTATLASSFFQNFGSYIVNFIPLNVSLLSTATNDWMGNWTLFYWAWWISWSPFVGMFIARISKG
jgi:choline/glycine/proline betaine transport protein